MSTKKSLPNMKPFIASQASSEVVEFATTYVNDYVSHIESVPFDLQKKVTRLREIDLACQDYIRKIESIYETFIKQKEPSIKSLLQLQQFLALCKELGDEKISIVEEINDVIECKNRKLEIDKRQFLSAHDPDHKEVINGKREKDGKYEGGKSAKRPRRSNQNDKVTLNDKTSENNGRAYSMYTPSIMPNTRVTLNEEKKKVIKSTKEKKEDKREKKEETRAVSKPESSNSPSTAIVPSISANSNNSTKSNNNTTSNKNAVKAKKKKRKVVRQSERHASEPVSPLMDIPIDPDEPTYCVCNQVSFGQMIGCDNKKCPIEWFHFSCVGLTHKPKGNWYCADCIQKKDRKKDKREK